MCDFRDLINAINDIGSYIADVATAASDDNPFEEMTTEPYTVSDRPLPDSTDDCEVEYDCEPSDYDGYYNEDDE